MPSGSTSAAFHLHPSWWNNQSWLDDNSPLHLATVATAGNLVSVTLVLLGSWCPTTLQNPSFGPVTAHQTKQKTYAIITGLCLWRVGPFQPCSGPTTRNHRRLQPHAKTMRRWNLRINVGSWNPKTLCLKTIQKQPDARLGKESTHTLAGREEDPLRQCSKRICHDGSFLAPVQTVQTCVSLPSLWSLHRNDSRNLWLCKPRLRPKSQKLT